jgi:hypothetical protein
MRKILAVSAVLAVAGCGGDEPEVVAEVDLADRLSPGCYTVDLFDPYTIEQPPEGAPDSAASFLGVWKNGAWNGQWCHDLYVTKVAADGTVEVLDAYGPMRSAGIEATVFRRKGHLQDGVLTFHSQGGKVEYRRDGDYLVGKRRGTLGSMEITMSRQDGVAVGEPIQPKKFVRKS